VEDKDKSVKEGCVHYWIIESPPYNRKNFRSNYDSLGSWSKGICKKCMEERMFNNSNNTKEIPIEREQERIRKEVEQQERGLQDG
tara:strand:- start:561 stop:815 length:255 start_codon:yes stop_codon:yes gene_type:complete